MGALGGFHTACGALALLLGSAIFLRTKGTRTHIWLGKVYLGCMICLNVSALAIYRLTGGFNIFHALAVLNLAIITVAIAHFFRRRGSRKWLWRHYQYMAWSYVGLTAATVNEASCASPISTNSPPARTRGLLWP